MSKQEIIEQLKNIKEQYLNDTKNEIDADVIIEALTDIIHDTEGTDAYNGFGTTMEDDGFYDTPDFTQLVIEDRKSVV